MNTRGILALTLFVVTFSSGRCDIYVQPDYKAQLTEPARVAFEKNVKGQVIADIKAGHYQLLCSGLEPILDTTLEVPGLSQVEVDGIKAKTKVALVLYIHNGHEWSVGENGIDSSELEKKWAFAEEYNRDLFAMLSGIQAGTKDRPNQSLEPMGIAVTPHAAHVSRQPYPWLTI